MDNLEQYGAVTIDNSIVKRYGVKFNKGLLAEFPKFRDITSSLIDFIISDIVYLEMKKHLREEEEKILGEFNKFSHHVNGYFSVDKNKISEITNILESQKEKSLDNFINSCGIQIINSGKFTDVSSLIDMYFHNKAPFAENGNKKYEFPDAIALLSLESWAKSNQKKILAISADDDWINFAKNSEWIDVIDDLQSLIVLFNLHRQKQQQEEYKANLLNQLLNIFEGKYRQNIGIYIEDEITSLTNQQIQNALIYIDSPYYYEIDDIESEIISIGYLTQPVLIDCEIEEYTKILLNCEIEFKLTGSVIFNIYDSIDREYIALSGTEIDEVITKKVEIIATFYGNLFDENNEIDIDTQMADNQLSEIMLGEISPFQDDYYEY